MATIYPIYTMDQLKEDKTFKAKPGQELTEEVYDEMLKRFPPKGIMPDAFEQARYKYGIICHAGFLMGDPVKKDEKGRALYHAFGCNEFGQFYYLGLKQSPKEKNGWFYRFGCLSVLNNDRNMFSVDSFIDDEQAINYAAEHEAALSKLLYVDGNHVKTKRLY